MPNRQYSEGIKERYIKAAEGIIVHSGMDRREIIPKLGITQSNYLRMTNSSGFYPTLEQCATLCNKYRVSADWLMTGKGSLYQVTKKASALELLNMATEAVKHELSKKKQ